MRTLKAFHIWLIVVGVAYIIVLAMNFNGHHANVPQHHDMVVKPTIGSYELLTDEYWAMSIYNPENAEFVVEVAFNEDCSILEVTQAQFNERYGQ